MPDAGDSWYTNSAANPQDRFEDYIAKEFIAEIDKSYRTIATRHARAIGRALHGRLRRHQVRAEVSATCSSLPAASAARWQRPTIADFRAYIGEKYSQQMQQVLGPPGEARNANDVYALAEKADPAALPYFWIACGTGDGLFESNRQFVALLHQRKIPYTLHGSPGHPQLGVLGAATAGHAARAGAPHGTQPRPSRAAAPDSRPTGALAPTTVMSLPARIG